MSTNPLLLIAGIVIVYFVIGIVQFIWLFRPFKPKDTDR